MSGPMFLLEDLPEEVMQTLRAREALLRGTGEDLEAVVDTLSRWRPGQTVRVAFRGGDAALHLKIAQVAAQIAWHCNLHLDFGWDPDRGTCRTWTTADNERGAEIRVGFDLGGYFSLVGTDSINPSIGLPHHAVGGLAHQTSLNLGGYDQQLPPDWKGTVLHEFMHAVGFRHEHANFRGPCQEAFRWDDDPGYELTEDSRGVRVPDAQGRRPGIYTYLGGEPNNWSRSKVDHNLRTAEGPGIAATTFDPASAMLYRFPPLFYKEHPSPCAPSGDGQSLSDTDIVGLQYLYPFHLEGIATDRRARASLVDRLPDGDEEAGPTPISGITAALRATLRAESEDELTYRASVRADVDGEDREGAGGDEDFEAVIRPKGRPSLPLWSTGFQRPADEPWKNLLEQKKFADIAVSRGRSVARVELGGLDDGFLGTAWMIADDIAVTNRHVAVVFAARLAGRWEIFWGDGVTLDFGARGEGPRFAVAEVLHIGSPSDPDIAFLRLAPTPGVQFPPAIPLAAQAPGFEEVVLTIGFPGDERTNGRHTREVLTDIFADTYEIKRLAPGRMMVDLVLDAPFARHDCSTLKGSSGSVVLNLAGEAAGLHFRGRPGLSGGNACVRPDRIADALERALAGDPGPSNVPGADEEDEAAPPASLLRSREGYVPGFLGEGFEIPHPDLGALTAVAVPVPGKQGDDRFHLDYLHYTVVMHAERRLALYTAVNIDGDQARRIKRSGTDRWYFDPRIPRALQSGNDLYAGNPLDRGHLVRRLDPAWGSRDVAEEASDETFFYTNCAPQHQDLNRKTWLSLEDHLLEHADNKNFRVSVFSGPINQLSDPAYRDEWRLPRAFWKVVAMVHTTRDTLSATGYIVSQEGLIEGLEFAFGGFRTYQVPIRRIEALTGLTFPGPDGPLRGYDPLDGQESAASAPLDSLDGVTL